MAIKNNRAKGTFYEEQAETFLKEQGYKILEKNYRNRRAEIDLIALKAETLIFVEVKYRKTNSYGYAQEAVNLAKQKKIYLAALDYLTRKNLNNYNIRFDVISINDKKLEWTQDGFWGDDFGV